MNCKFFFASAAIAFATLAALPASASCVGTCPPPVGTTTYQPPLAPSFPAFTMNVQGKTYGYGYGETVVGGTAGAIGNVFAERDSYLDQNLTSYLESDLCPANSCGSGGFSIDQTVRERVATGGYVTNHGGVNTAASIMGSTFSEALTNLNIRFDNPTPAAPPPVGN